MKILYLPTYFFPENAASSYLVINRVEAFAQNDMDVEIYVPTPTRGLDVKTRDDYKKNRIQEYMFNNKVYVHRFSLYGEGKNPILRALRYTLCCCLQLYYGLKSKDCDILFTPSTPPIQGAMSAIIKKRKKIPFVYNLQDIFPDSMVGTGLTKKGGLLWKIGRKIEDYTYKNADKIIVISEDFKKNIMAKGVPEDKIKVIYNWVDQNAVVNVDRTENKLFDKYRLDRRKFYLVYSGNIGLTQNMDMLLDVMEDLKDTYPEINLVLIGDGAYKSKVEKIVGEKQLNNVLMLPFQDYSDISHVFSLGDVGLVISKPGVGANSVPSKTWSIMSASRPVLANFDENELKDILESNECGIFTVAGCKDAFKQAIISLYNDRQLCKVYGANGRKFVMANLTREVGTAKYIEVIRSVIK